MKTEQVCNQKSLYHKAAQIAHNIETRYEGIEMPIDALKEQIKALNLMNSVHANEIKRAQVTGEKLRVIEMKVKGTTLDPESPDFL